MDKEPVKSTRKYKSFISQSFPSQLDDFSSFSSHLEWMIWPISNTHLIGSRGGGGGHSLYK